MGLGGILASMAQGFGSGMIKVADEAWKKESEDRKYQFYADENAKERTFKADEAEKDRAWQEKKIGMEHKNSLSLAAYNSALRIKEKRAESQTTPAMKDARYMDQYFKGGDVILGELNATNQQLSEMQDNDPAKKNLMYKKAKLEEDYTKFANDAKASEIVSRGALGEEVKATYNKYTGMYNGYYTPPKAVSEAPTDKPSVLPLSPESQNDYLVDIRNQEDLKRAQEKIAQEKRLKAREEQLKQTRDWKGQTGYWGIYGK